MREIHYFVSAHTAKGYQSFLKENLKGRPVVVCGYGAARALEKIKERAAAGGMAGEFLYSPGERGELCGINLPNGFCAASGGEVAAPPPGAIVFDLDEALSRQGIEAKKLTIKRLLDESKRLYNGAYAEFAKALKIHDEWERVYIENLSPQKADEAADELCARLFDALDGKGGGAEGDGAAAEIVESGGEVAEGIEDGGSEGEGDEGEGIAGAKVCEGGEVAEGIEDGGGEGEGAPVVWRRFIGSATPRGNLNFVNSITEEFARRIFIKGRPGSGKSTLLRKVLARAQERGFSAEVYHCGFDPQSLDAVVIREAGICLFDSTPPHEFFPCRAGDEIFDTYEKSITIGTDDRNRERLIGIKSRYRGKILAGMALLEKGYEMAAAAGRIYEGEIDEAKEKGLFEEIFTRLGI